MNCIVNWMSGAASRESKKASSGFLRCSSAIAATVRLRHFEHRIRQLVSDSRTMIGLSDGGAHVNMVCDAGYCLLLGTWVRERRAMSLEQAVKRITSDRPTSLESGIAAVSSPGSRPTSRFSTSIESALQNARGCKTITRRRTRL